ncbi:50S ribosomal protein L23 [Candidatus Woesearchaeota archaeon]|jgi:ribosomal protein uL23|nr:50S ribosomal protein L23 [Candidatus Woesearchaeota archaeon]
MDSYKIIKYPLSTEKAIRLMESENKLVLIVELKARKPEIKKAVEEVFKVKVTNVNTLITMDGTKKAYVTLSEETPALDVVTDLGLM